MTTPQKRMPDYYAIQYNSFVSPIRKHEYHHINHVLYKDVQSVMDRMMEIAELHIRHLANHGDYGLTHVAHDRYIQIVRSSDDVVISQFTVIDMYLADRRD